MVPFAGSREPLGRAVNIGHTLRMPAESQGRRRMAVVRTLFIAALLVAALGWIGSAGTGHAVRPAHPVRLSFTIRNPDTRAVVRSFATVHDKQYHLFVVSHDLEHYDHVHPEMQADGSWRIDVTVPKAGHYKLFSDFLPIGG